MNGFSAQYPEMVNSEMGNSGMQNTKGPTAFAVRLAVVLGLAMLFETGVALSGAFEFAPLWLLSAIRIGLGVILGAWMFSECES